MKFIMNWLDFDSFIYCTKLSIIQKRYKQTERKYTTYHVPGAVLQEVKAQQKAKPLPFWSLPLYYHGGR